MIPPWGPFSSSRRRISNLIQRYVIFTNLRWNFKKKSHVFSCHFGVDASTSSSNHLSWYILVLGYGWCVSGVALRDPQISRVTWRPPLPPPQKKKKTVHPIRLTWNLRTHPWKRKVIFQTIIFSGSMFIFQGVYLSKLHCLRIFGGCISCIFIPRSHGTQRSTALLVAVGQPKKPNDMRKFTLQLQAFFLPKNDMLTCYVYIYIV